MAKYTNTALCRTNWKSMSWPWKLFQNQIVFEFNVTSPYIPPSISPSHISHLMSTSLLNLLQPRNIEIYVTKIRNFLKQMFYYLLQFLLSQSCSKVFYYIYFILWKIWNKLNPRGTRYYCVMRIWKKFLSFKYESSKACREVFFQIVIGMVCNELRKIPLNV